MALNQAETAVSSALRYDGYGQTLDTYAAGTLPTPWKYQGRLDVSPDASDPLYDAGARFYSPAIGAFTQLDTVAGSAQDPLSMNRYLYAGANPSSMIDPDGHMFIQGPQADVGGNSYHVKPTQHNVPKGSSYEPIQRKSVYIAPPKKASPKPAAASPAADQLFANAWQSSVITPAESQQIIYQASGGWNLGQWWSELNSPNPCATGQGWNRPECGKTTGQALNVMACGWVACTEEEQVQDLADQMVAQGVIQNMMDAGMIIGAEFSGVGSGVPKSSTRDAARFVVNSAGEARMSLRAGSASLEVTDHAAMRMTQRGVSIDAAEKTLAQQSFPYFHQGVWKNGYYDPASRIFLGSVNGRVTTVITDASPTYIQNLKAVIP